MVLRRREGDGDGGGTIGCGLADDATAFDRRHKAGFLDAEGDGELGRSGGLVEQQDGVAVAAVLALGEADIARTIGIERTGGIDGLAVLVHPYAYLLHAFKSLGGQVALRVGAHVQKEVAAFGHNVDQHVDELGGALIMVTGDVRPAVAHGHAGLPRIGQQSVWHLLLGGAVILVAAAH